MLKWKFLCPNNFGSIGLGSIELLIWKGFLIVSDMKHVDSISFGFRSSYIRFTGYAVGPGAPLFLFFPTNIGAMKFFDSFILSYKGLKEGIYWLQVQGPSQFQAFSLRIQLRSLFQSNSFYTFNSSCFLLFSLAFAINQQYPGPGLMLSGIYPSLSTFVSNDDFHPLLVVVQNYFLSQIYSPGPGVMVSFRSSLFSRSKLSSYFLSCLVKHFLGLGLLFSCLSLSLPQWVGPGVFTQRNHYLFSFEIKAFWPSRL